MCECQLRGRVLRKPRAVGLIPGGSDMQEKVPEGSGGKTFRRESLDEVVMRVQDALDRAQLRIPYCAFNGGNDVFVDVGNKIIGLTTLMNYLGYSGRQTLHVGDRFTSTGNDSRVRDACSILWVASPDETTFFMRLLYRDIVNMRVL